MKKFLIVLILLGLLPSILYSQSNDTTSVRCFTVKQQNDIIAKLVRRIELEDRVIDLSMIISKQDSSIVVYKRDIEILKDENIVLIKAYEIELANVKIMEKQVKKEENRKKVWRGISVGAVAVLILKFIIA